MLWVRISIRARFTTLCDNICQWVVAGRWLTLGSSTKKKTYRHDIAEILLKVALSTNKQNKNKLFAIMIAVTLLTSLVICSSYIILLLIKLTFSSIWNHRQLWLSCLCPILILLPTTYILFDSPVIWLWVYLMKIIPEMCRVYAKLDIDVYVSA
jgi:hypothetical protein